MNKLRRIVATLLIACIALPLPGHAGMISTEAAVGAHGRVAQFLDREDVGAKLEAYGVQAADVKARVAAMTDEEAATLAGRIDELPAGGVVGILLTVFLVLLITDILGLTKVFPFTKPLCDRGKC
jgi:hypothetical protein